MERPGGLGEDEIVRWGELKCIDVGPGPQTGNQSECSFSISGGKRFWPNTFSELQELVGALMDFREPGSPRHESTGCPEGGFLFPLKPITPL